MQQQTSLIPSSAIKLFITGIIATAFYLTLSLFLAQATHAASFTVAAGNDENTDNSSCALSEAIENINNQATTNTDCSPTGAYGTNDTINLPAGTITLTADLAPITESVTIQGQGMGVSIVDGDGAYSGLSFEDSASLREFTIKAFFGIGTVGSGSSFTLDQLEVDGTNAVANGALGGILTAAGSVTMSNVYVHDMAADGATSIFSISVHAVQGLSVEATIDNTTIENITSNDTQVAGLNPVTGLLDSSFTPGNIHLVVKNSTIANLSSATQGAVGLAALATVNQGDTEISVDLINNTFANIQGANSLFGASSDLALAGFAGASEDSAQISVHSTNNLLTGDAGSCLAAGDIGALLGLGASAGTVSNSFTSTGGNLSDDNSCSPYFTQASDQNNIANLSSTLSALADNGGYVPTMALLPNSPAIDSGVTVAGLTTDARLATRPQGTAYDSGAYESPYTKASTANLASTGQNQPLLTLLTLTATALLGVGLVVRRGHGA